MKEKDIVHEEGEYWIARVPLGFEVYKLNGTHSVRCAQIGYVGDIGLRRAKAEIERRTGQK